jgi:hypothetical protein
MTAALAVRDLRVVAGHGARRAVVLDRVDLDLEPGRSSGW